MELVVGASEATMKSLLSKLGGLLAHEYALIRGIRGDIQYISDEMTSMQVFLGDLSSTVPHGHDRRMKDWMKQVRDVTYDIEDCVDDFAQRLSDDPGGDVCCAFVVSRVYELLTWWPRRNIASNIIELKMRAQQIGERRIRYGVENPKSGEGHSGTGFDATADQQTSLELVGTKIPVGLDEVMKELGKWVRLSAEETQSSEEIETQQSQMDSVEILQEAGPSLPNPARDPTSQTEPKKQNQHPDGVLSIVGYGGVGKTTITTALYHKFGYQFERRAMVTVSQNSKVEAILGSILSQVMLQSGDDNEHQGSCGGGGALKMVQALTKHLEEYRSIIQDHSKLSQGLFGWAVAVGKAAVGWLSEKAAVAVGK